MEQSPYSQKWCKRFIIYTNEHIENMDLVTRLSAGDESAFTQMWRKHYASLYGFAMSFIANASQAEDMVADVFLKLWNLRKNFEGKSEANVKAYLMVTMKNQCIDVIRELNHKEKIKRELLYHQETVEQIQFNESVRQEVILHITELADKLPARMFEIFELAYFQGKSNEEISELLGITYNVVANQKSRALIYLRKAIKERAILVALAAFILKYALPLLFSLSFVIANIK